MFTSCQLIFSEKIKGTVTFDFLWKKSLQQSKQWFFEIDCIISWSNWYTITKSNKNACEECIISNYRCCITRESNSLFYLHRGYDDLKTSFDTYACEHSIESCIDRNVCAWQNNENLTKCLMREVWYEKKKKIVVCLYKISSIGYNKHEHIFMNGVIFNRKKRLSLGMKEIRVLLLLYDVIHAKEMKL